MDTRFKGLFSRCFALSEHQSVIRNSHLPFEDGYYVTEKEEVLRVRNQNIYYLGVDGWSYCPPYIELWYDSMKDFSDIPESVVKELKLDEYPEVSREEKTQRKGQVAGGTICLELSDGAEDEYPEVSREEKTQRKGQVAGGTICLELSDDAEDEDNAVKGFGSRIKELLKRERRKSQNELKLVHKTRFDIRIPWDDQWELRVQKENSRDMYLDGYSPYSGLKTDAVIRYYEETESNKAHVTIETAEAVIQITATRFAKETRADRELRGVNEWDQTVLWFEVGHEMVIDLDGRGFRKCFFPKRVGKDIIVEDNGQIVMTMHPEFSSNCFDVMTISGEIRDEYLLYAPCLSAMFALNRLDALVVRKKEQPAEGKKADLRLLIEGQKREYNFSKKSIIVGRAYGDLAFEDAPNQKCLSRQHAEFRFVHGHWWIRDLDSHNGTYVNGKRLEPRNPRKLSPGDRIAFAGVQTVVYEPLKAPDVTGEYGDSPVETEIDYASYIQQKDAVMLSSTHTRSVDGHCFFDTTWYIPKLHAIVYETRGTKLKETQYGRVDIPAALSDIDEIKAYLRLH